jgi:hypothetical protein
MKALAQPFEKPDELVARAMAALAAMPESSRPALAAKPPPAPRSKAGHMRSSAFSEPILACLREAGGKATVPQVREWLRQRLGSQFTAADRQILPIAKEPRWWKNAAWERNRLAHAGLLRDDSPKGVWELSDTMPPTVAK